MPSGISYLASSLSPPPPPMSSPSPSVTTYLQGHDPATLESHRSRTASRIASYLLPYLKPHSRILDIGCGPGTITCDFAGFCPRGEIIGLDYSAKVIQEARREGERRGVRNVRFETGRAEELGFEDEMFDVVHCNAVLVHMPDAVRVLKEMRRVCKIGGIVACREPDWDMCTIHPHDSRLEQWLNCHRTLKRSEGIEPNAGRYLAEWAIRAGFEEKKVRVSCDALQYAGREQVKWWGELEAKRMWTERAQRAVASGVATKEDVEAMEKAFLEWSAKPGAIWVLMHMRLLATK